MNSQVGFTVRSCRTLRLDLDCVELLALSDFSEFLNAADYLGFVKFPDNDSNQSLGFDGQAMSHIYLRD